MAKPNIDISLEGVWDKPGAARRNRGTADNSRASCIDIPLDRGCPRAGGAAGISDKELEFVNRHHEAYKEQRRRARQQGD